MKIVVARRAGFCFGVKRAIKAAYETAGKETREVATLGPLIHNPQVVARLEEMNVRTVGRIEDFHGDILIIRSHGVPKAVLEEARQAGIEVIDATCPFVKNAQEYAAQLHADGYRVVIVGDESHPEVRGIKAYAGEPAFVISDGAGVTQLKGSRKIGIVAQTTTTMEKFMSVVGPCLEIAREVKIFNTICDATHVRQKEAQKIARTVDLMLVVGGRNSGNTSRLSEICGQTGTPTRHIETHQELEREWFQGVDRVGITGGASTPDWIIEDVVARLQEIAGDGDVDRKATKS